ncbi:MAG: GMC family oxidoreductase [Bacteroidales bacterium]|nr:GMC family oxidoreductase [Bacteroidales bacterium]
MVTDCDVCIIGSGAGAGPVVYTLANLGKKVIVLEKGGWFTEKDFYKDEIAVCRRDTFTPPLEKEPHVIEDIDSDGKWVAESNAINRRNFWNGNMVGGSSNLMSGFFHRMKPVDFRLKSEFGAVEGANVVDWPVGYDDLERYYVLTEALVGISGKVVSHPFLEPRSTNDFPFSPLAEHAISKYIDKASESLGYNIIPTPRAIISRPVRNRLACSYSGYCGSYGCSTGAKGSSRALLDLAVKSNNCEIRPNSRAYKIETDSSGKIQFVKYFNQAGKTIKINAKIYVIACQAVETSRILLLSSGAKFPNGLANNSGQVGKNLLFSAGGIGSGIFTSDQFSREEFSNLRDIHLFVNRALQDWYVIDDPKLGPQMKGGTIDFLMAHANPIRRAQKVKRKEGKLLWGRELKERLKEEFTNKIRLNFEIFCDWMPNNDCFVELSKSIKDKDGIPVAKIRVGYHPHDLIPGKYLAEKAENVMRKMNTKEIRSSISGSPPANLMAGGCRFGNNPEESVLDKNCRAHEVENLFVTDGSFMPTGGSVPYTWTIYANSFRVANVIASEV